MKWKLFLIAIALCGFLLRIYQLNWDDNYHFHPDERHITMVTERIAWISPIVSWDVFISTGSLVNPDFFSIDSSMNPKFFAYGSFALYLLAFTGWLASFVNPELAMYDGLNQVGRIISALFDTGTILLVYGISKKISFPISQTKHSKLKHLPNLIGITAAGLYSLSVLPIQLSHYYAVDTLLTFFITFLIYLLISHHHKSAYWKVILLGIVLGLALATKTTAVFVIPPILLAFYWPSVANIIRVIQHQDNNGTLGNKMRNIVFMQLLAASGYLILLFISACIVFIIVEPYALIDYLQFKKDHLLQSQMATNAWIFPYTLQYVGTKAYLYPLLQIANWGTGWTLFLAACIGLCYALYLLARGAFIKCFRHRDTNSLLYSGSFFALTLIVFFSSSYFIFFGQSAVKFMRYYLPLYPFISVFAAWGIWHLSYQGITSRLIHFPSLLAKSLSFIVIIPTLVWTVAFLNIYSQPNTRIQASKWIARHIEKGSVLGIEHWDDALPVPPWHQGFEQKSLPLYEPDTYEKWQLMAKNLESSDAIIIASNRLTAPLTRLSWKYPITNQYYEMLFAEKLGFIQAAQFTNYPNLGPVEFPDQDADESFHVYDHPKVIVFVKQQPLTASEYFRRITDNKPI